MNPRPTPFQRFMRENHVMVFGFGIPLGFLALAFLGGPPPKRPPPPPTVVTLTPEARQELAEAIVQAMTKDAGTQ